MTNNNLAKIVLASSLALGLASCSNRTQEPNDQTIIGKPLNSTANFVRNWGCYSAVIEVDGKPILVYNDGINHSIHYDRYSAKYTKAVALFEAAKLNPTNNVIFHGNYKGGEFKANSLEALTYTINFQEK